MSYSICFGVETTRENYRHDNHAIVWTPELYNPTYNLSAMFKACMDWDFEQDKWYPMAVVLTKIERGIHELTENREEYEKYNPPNGWGSLDDALECLKSWRKEIAGAYPTWSGCVTDVWPIDALYWMW